LETILIFYRIFTVIMKKNIAYFCLLSVLALFFSACGSQNAISNQITGSSDEKNATVQFTIPDSGTGVSPTETLVPTTTPTFTPTQQSTGMAGRSGPQIGDFPVGINPLTGLKVTDPSLLSLPAVLISIPNFPVDARPQAGLSFVPWLFEIYIGEGTSRFLATFYGEEPRVDPILHGSCQVRLEPFVPGAVVLGNRVWLDENSNGIQEPNEPGIAGVCVTLFDADGKTLQTTSTDSNGFYGFNVNSAQAHQLGFEKLNGLTFTTPDVGLDNLDSDVIDSLTGLTGIIDPSKSNFNWDAGFVRLTPSEQPASTLAPGTPTAASGNPAWIANLPPPDVGPIRSMRLPYGKIGKFFQGGCIVSASGDPSVLAQVPGCKYVYGDNTNVSHALLSITDLHTLAENNKTSYPINYSGNVFDATPPPGGKPANELNVLWNWQNQSLFRYDPLSGSYQRFANLPDTPLSFYPQTDRLTDRQLLYDNLIVMYVEYSARAETLMDINLQIGNMGRSDLFRNGQVYHIYWNTIAQSYEQKTQLARPIRFTDAQGNPIPLAPGHTWVHVFTTASVVYEKNLGSGLWTGEFHAPLVP
jgi:hypothetical protein